MKLFAYFFVTLILFLFYGCGSGLDDSPPLYDYDLEFRFEDPEGNDLVAGIPVENNGSVEEIVYRLSSDISEKLPSPLCVVKRTEYESLLFSEATYGSDKPKSEITYYFKCRYIFGNDDVHTIKTYWEKSDIDKYIRYCKYVELDGTSYPVVFDENEYISKASLTVVR